MDQRTSARRIAAGTASAKTWWLRGRNAGCGPLAPDFGRTWQVTLTEQLHRGTDRVILAVDGDDVYLSREGFLGPYGAYLELDIDSTGQTVALWGEGNGHAGLATSGSPACDGAASTTAGGGG